MIIRHRLLLTVLAAFLALAVSEVTSAQDSADPVLAMEELQADEVFEDAVQKAEPSAVGSTALVDKQPSGYDNYMSGQQRNAFFFAILLAVTALIAHALVLRSLPKNGDSASSDAVVSATGLIYIIFGTILLVVIAHTDEQMTAAVGILGAVAGYLFGKQKKEKTEPLPGTG